MKENFKKSLAQTLRWEGGFSNHAKDPGGATNKGITLKTYRRYKRSATVKDLKNIPQSMVEKIYRDGYWAKANCDRLDDGVDFAVFDYAVNSGPGAAWKSLLKVVGDKQGYRTVQKLCRRRLAIYKTFKHWTTFGKGWTRRINGVEAKGVRWAKDGGTAVLSNEAAKSDRRAKQIETGAGTAGIGGGAGAVTQTSGWPLVIVIVAIVGGIGFAVWKARQDRDRAKAYREELESQE